MPNGFSLAAFATNWTWYAVAPLPTGVEAELASPHAKKKFARTLLEQVCDLFNIEHCLDELADMFADPATRRAATSRMFECGYKPGIDFAGVGIGTTMDDVYADNGHGYCRAVVIPEAWPTDLWNSDRDHTDDGIEYRHWVAATLPAAHLYTDSDGDGGYKAVLLSDKLYGTLCWGGYLITLAAGHVTMRKTFHADVLDKVAAEAEPPGW